eukprot:gnl/TRDRNA2_/TRDRNA2_133694_c0_seq4.p1 gnl/TRDRNA2_/TRDRNA2_133694_c0~~gnl/TRDRNA2_/TRDRNA2_133694_c0_seq4.p1  ORF type:complete len:194 (+),score=29.33 gnl/TRDRNA2_/TRDRNA2_133694_c0_seq4:41-583(+)
MSSEASGGASRRSSQNSKADSKGHQATAGPKSLYVQKKKDPLLLCEEVINVLKSRNVQVKRISTGATAAGDAGGAVEENGFILEERYRGITGRLMVPNYAGQHVPSLEQEKVYPPPKGCQFCCALWAHEVASQRFSKSGDRDIAVKGPAFARGRARNGEPLWRSDTRDQASSSWYIVSRQ